MNPCVKSAFYELLEENEIYPLRMALVQTCTNVLAAQKLTNFLGIFSHSVLYHLENLDYLKEKIFFSYRKAFIVQQDSFLRSEGKCFSM